MTVLDERTHEVIRKLVDAKAFSLKLSIHCWQLPFGVTGGIGHSIQGNERGQAVLGIEAQESLHHTSLSKTYEKISRQ